MKTWTTKHDIVLLTSMHKNMKDKMDKRATIAPRIGLRMSIAKIKLMKTTAKMSLRHCYLIINGDAAEEVQDFRYLERRVSTDGHSTSPMLEYKKLDTLTLC